jgi:RNA polymerase sigma-70 factor (ECF subfamily)
MKNPNPEILIKRARNLDQKALTAIYDLYSDSLYAYAFRQVGKAQLAEDFVSETFFRFLGALEKGGGPKKHLRAYLYRITHNLITDYYRRESNPALELEEEILETGQPGPKEIFNTKQETERVRRALMMITPEQRQVVVLRFLEGWSSSEIAQAMEKSLGAVKALQHRGVAALQRILLEGDNTKPPPSKE